MVALAVALTLAAIDWVAVAQRRRHLEYIFKPATLLVILIGAWLLTRGPHDAWQARFFLLGLGLSLAGDILLMLRRECFFSRGLVAFLLAHLCYIVGMNHTPPPWPDAAVLIPVVAIGLALHRSIEAGLRRRDQSGLLAPVAIYSLVLASTLFSAWGTLFRPDWSGPRRALVIVGASLFFASDAMLAWDRFVAPSPSARLRIHVTYHLGQIALAASVALIG